MQSTDEGIFQEDWLYRSIAKAKDYDAEIVPLLSDPHKLYSYVLNTAREHVDRYHAIMSAVDYLKPHSVLDLGCSIGLTGWFLQWPGSTIEELHGADWSESACIIAQNWHKYDKVWYGPLETLDIGHDYDLVIVTEVLEHVVSPEKILEVAKAHCKPGGRVLVSTPQESGDIDGRFHIRKVAAHHLVKLMNTYFTDVTFWFVRSHYCEKPHWEGWNFARGTV